MMLDSNRSALNSYSRRIGLRESGKVVRRWKNTSTTPERA
jgi:hypothetical protein